MRGSGGRYKEKELGRKERGEGGSKGSIGKKLNLPARILIAKNLTKDGKEM